jgi:hypothetical protein
MGNLDDRPELLPPVGGEATPIKREPFFPRPTKWQICMPRLRFVAKIFAFLIFTALCLKVLSQGPPKPRSGPISPSQPPDNPEQNFREPTEAEMIERSKREEWIWKDYDLWVASRVTCRSRGVLTPNLDITV